MSTLVLDASAIGGTIQLPWTGSVFVPSTGRVTVDLRDVPVCLAMGMSYVRTVSNFQALAAAPRVASTGRIVSSTSLANGTLSIANQPDVPRVLALRVDTGTSAITAGVATAIYKANTGATVTDAISLAAPASTLVTTNTTYGVVSLTSLIVTAVAGGASPKIQLSDTNALSVQVPPGFAAFAGVSEVTDGVAAGVGTVNSTAASIVPSTTPNATHTYGWYYNYSAPSNT